MMRGSCSRAQLGNVERYCEIMRDLGEWERAIALAPAVSHELWAKLVKEYAAEKLSKNAARLADLLPWYIAINQPETLVNLYLNNEQYEDAVTLAQVTLAGIAEHPPARAPASWFLGHSRRGLGSRSPVWISTVRRDVRASRVMREWAMDLLKEHVSVSLQYPLTAQVSLAVRCVIALIAAFRSCHIGARFEDVMLEAAARCLCF